MDVSGLEIELDASLAEVVDSYECSLEAYRQYVATRHWTLTEEGTGVGYRLPQDMYHVAAEIYGVAEATYNANV